ncbi:hypothetical protein ACFQS6_23045 [Xanthomonas populi]|uniref:Transposase n=1 Tax=Xanthomonas populi TaxID=53414 RepID=A0A2S7EQX1_9XANT|nr:hypothetical protein [Xanthomonas populi]PPU95464.1 hypothetical protein XpopCFBP1817_08695 [Xanthomonas populi]
MSERCDAQDKALAILQARHALYQQARHANPARWSGNTRNWEHIGAVALNPEKASHDTQVDTRRNILIP